MTIWMDLTNSLIINRGNVVGIVRAELMLAKHLHEVYPSIRFSVALKQGFREIPLRSLKWLWQSDNINDDYVRYQKSKRTFLSKLFHKIDSKLFKISYRQQRHHRPKWMKRSEFIVWPYKNGDTVFSCGWFDPQKENYFSRVKTALSDLKLIYTIYDLAILQDSLAAAYSDIKLPFENYLQWISKNADAIIYGGKNAQIDTEKYFKEKSLPIPAGFPIQWGSDIKGKKAPDLDIVTKLEIDKPFILAVGSFDWKKNYQVLYRAYCWAAIHGIDLPLLVIVGRIVNDIDLSGMFVENPILYKKIRIIAASDEELDALYTNCLFTVLPTLYEGWSLTLPESFMYGKMCLCSDVAPLRETGADFAYYLNPYHPVEWARTISDFATYPNKIKIYEQKIQKNWHITTWKQSAETLLKVLQKVAQSSRQDKPHPHSKKEELKRPSAKIYYDLSLISYPLTGIPRTQMFLARYLYQIRQDIEFFYMSKENYYYVPTNQLSHLLSNEKIDIAVEKDKVCINGIDCPIPFKKGDIVCYINGGIDNRSHQKLLQLHQEIGFTFISSIFDFTPLTVPHTHPKERVDFYPIFLKNVYALSDFIIYGGKTAQQDGESFQKQNNLPVTHSLAVKWGNDLVSKTYSEKEAKNILERCGITGDYILTVGTIEARKNQKILYDAYLELLQDEEMKGKMPQLVICGHLGWKTDDFVHLLKNDQRIKNKVIMFSPTDEELDVLYQNCKFTCLASFYEGWSLTLPESLNYGKFCLTADTSSLKETGEDIADYADPYDPVDWAQKIKYYLLNSEALEKREKLIKQKWHNTTWYDCAKNINNFFESLSKKEKSDDK